MLPRVRVDRSLLLSPFSFPFPSSKPLRRLWRLLKRARREGMMKARTPDGDRTLLPFSLPFSPPLFFFHFFFPSRVRCNDEEGRRWWRRWRDWRCEPPSFSFSPPPLSLFSGDSFFPFTPPSLSYSLPLSWKKSEKKEVRSATSPPPIFFFSFPSLTQEGEERKMNMARKPLCSSPSFFL